MGVFGFLMGLGKSREAKMAIWILEHTQKHIATMVRRSSEYWDACRQFPMRKAELDNMAGAAFIAYFFLCLSQEIGEKWQEVYMDFAFNTSSNMRQLIEECIKSNSQTSDDINSNDIVESSRFGCAKWLYDEMRIRVIQSIASIESMMERHRGEHEFTNVFMDECLVVRAEIVPFKEKFL